MSDKTRPNHPHTDSQESEQHPWLGRVLGHWRLDSFIGAGGMGEVYAASRIDGEIAHQAAIKIMPQRIVDDATSLARFGLERQILSELSHPFICRLLDADTTRSGQPYFVMELLQGQRLDEWAAQKRSQAHQLQLFLHLSDALQYAHQKLVIHRDLKPGNILVMDDDTPRILDFGTAKRLDDHAGNLTEGASPMTPRYAAPEQVRGESVSTATDIYALGILLWELLTGESPYGEATSNPYQLSRMIADGTFKLPKNTPGLDDDLIAIIRTATALDPEDRYRSVTAMADDVQHYLNGQPVSVRKPTVPQRLRFWLRRNPVTGAVLGTSFLALCVTVAVLTWQWQQVLKERDLAQATTDFMIQLFDTANPESASYGSNDLETLLDAGIQTFEDSPPEDQATRGRLAASLASIAGGIGNYERAQTLYQRALDEDPGNPDLILKRAEAQYYAGIQTPEREPLQNIYDNPNATREQRAEAISLISYLDTYAGEFESALDAIEKSLALYPEDSLLRAAYLDARAHVYAETGDMQAGLADSQEALRIRQKLLPETHFKLSSAHNNVAYFLDKVGKLDESIAQLREAIRIGETVVGEDAANLPIMYSNLALRLSRTGQLEEAEALSRRALDIFVDEYGREHYSTALGFNSLATILEARGKFAAAVEQSRLSLPGITEHPALQATLKINLARRLAMLGESDQANAVYAEASPVFRELYAADTARIARIDAVGWLLQYQRGNPLDTPNSDHAWLNAWGAILSALRQGDCRQLGAALADLKTEQPYTGITAWADKEFRDLCADAHL